MHAYAHDCRLYVLRTGDQQTCVLCLRHACASRHMLAFNPAAHTNILIQGTFVSAQPLVVMLISGCRDSMVLSTMPTQSGMTVVPTKLPCMCLMAVHTTMSAVWHQAMTGSGYVLK